MAQGLNGFSGDLLADANGQLVGAMGLDGKEYLFPAALNASAATTVSINGVPIGATTASTGTFTTITTTSVLSATGSGAKTLTSTGAFNVNVGALGSGTTIITRLNSLTVVSTDSSGTPGNATNNNLGGRAAFAAAASTVVVTNSLVTAASKVFISLLGPADATLKYVVVTPGAGSFTVTGNAAATATTRFDFLVVN